MIDPLEEERSQHIADFRGFLDFMESRNLPLPYWMNSESLDVYIFEEAELLAARQALGNVKKEVTNYAFGFSKRFGFYNYKVMIGRESVCERIVIGTKKIPARDAYVEDIVEWVCPESFLAKLGDE